MGYGSLRFDDADYCGIFTRGLELIWCDNAQLFGKITRAADKINAALSESSGSYEMMLRHDKKQYRAVFTVVSGELVLCRVSPAINRDKLRAELNEEIENLSCGALCVINLIDSIRESADSGDNETLRGCLTEQRKEAESIYTECLSISNKFLFKSEEQYVPLHKLIIGTMQKIGEMTKGRGRRIMCSIDIGYPFVKTDYPAFEKAVYNLAKLYFKCGAGNAEMYFITDDQYTLRTEYTFGCPDAEALKRSAEIRGAESGFAALGGELRFSVSDGTARFIGRLPVNCTFSRKKAEGGSGASFSRYAAYDNMSPVGKKSGGEDYLKSPPSDVKTAEKEGYGEVIFGSIRETED